MTRSTLILSVCVALLAAGLIALYATRPQPGVTDSQVHEVVASMVAEEMEARAAPMNTVGVDPATIHPMIESYLLANPRILERVSVALRAEIEAEKAQKAEAAIASLQEEIYQDPDHVVLGNPDGDVTLVEFFDYNCGYCRSALPDLVALLDEDPNLKVILKEFPILSQGSMDAARLAVAFNRTDGDYWDFHQALFSSRGQVTKQTALDAAKAQDINPVELELEAQSEDVAQVIQRSFTIAEALDITGTPSYIIGNEIIPGAIGLEGLRERIANMRACGSTVCEG